MQEFGLGFLLSVYWPWNHWLNLKMIVEPARSYKAMPVQLFFYKMVFELGFRFF